jgi:hypothetical protein
MHDCGGRRSCPTRLSRVPFPGLCVIRIRFTLGGQANNLACLCTDITRTHKIESPLPHIMLGRSQRIMMEVCMRNRDMISIDRCIHKISFISLSWEFSLRILNCSRSTNVKSPMGFGRLHCTYHWHTAVPYTPYQSTVNTPKITCVSCNN